MMRFWLCGLVAMLSACGPLECPDGLKNFDKDKMSLASSAPSKPPALTINRKPSEITAATNVSFEFTADQPDATFECALNSGVFAKCESPVILSDLREALYTMSIKARGRGGLMSEVSVFAWRVDKNALSVSITSQIAAFTKAKSATIDFAKVVNAATIAGFECRMDNNPFAACTSPFSVGNLSEGLRKFEVRALDPSGNYSSSASLAWTVDVTAPAVTITSGPNGLVSIGATQSALATFTFTASDTNFQQAYCKLDANSEMPCSISASFAVPGDGTGHVFYIRVVDKAGNESTVSRAFTYYWDYGGPIDSGSN